MSTSSALTVYRPNPDLSASGYTPSKMLYFSTTVNVNNCVVDPVYRLIEGTYRLFGITSPVFSRRWDEIPFPSLLEFKFSRLFLGVLPVKNKWTGYSDADVLLKMNIRAVVCLTEGFENNMDGYILKAITREEWESKGVAFKQLESPDHCGIDQKTIYEAVAFLDEQLQKGDGDVYVHCKAGKSRSAAIVYCLLRKKFPRFFPTHESTVEYLQKYRSQVWFEEQKVHDILHFIELQQLAMDS